MKRNTIDENVGQGMTALGAFQYAATIFNKNVFMKGGI